MTVILPFLDEVRYLEGAVATVAAQTLRSWELLLVDDGSSDGSEEIADRAAAADPRVTVLRHPHRQHRGLPESRNLGLAVAAACYVAFLDADDRWAGDKLALQVGLLGANAAAAMVCGPTWYGDGGLDRGLLVPVSQRSPSMFDRGQFARHLLSGRLDPPPPSAVMFRADALRAVGGVPRGDNLYEDQRTFFAVSLRYPILVSDLPVSSYTVRRDSLYGSLHDDPGTRLQQRRGFERWATGWGLRQGAVGRFAVTELHARKLFRGVRGSIRRGAAALRQGIR